jgi:hypothetical protein
MPRRSMDWLIDCRFYPRQRPPRFHTVCESGTALFSFMLASESKAIDLLLARRPVVFGVGPRTVASCRGLLVGADSRTLIMAAMDRSVVGVWCKGSGSRRFAIGGLGECKPWDCDDACHEHGGKKTFHHFRSPLELCSSGVSSLVHSLNFFSAYKARYKLDSTWFIPSKK